MMFELGLESSNKEGCGNPPLMEGNGSPSMIPLSRSAQILIHKTEPVVREPIYSIKYLRVY